MKLPRDVLLSACLVLPSCASDRFQERVDQVFEIRKEASYQDAARVPWSVGQWALFRITDTSGETLFRAFSGETRGFRRYSITRKEGRTFWLEVHDVLPDEERLFALQVENVHPDHMRDLRLLKVKVLGSDGSVESLDAEDDGPAAVRELRERFTMFTGASDLAHGSGRVRKVTVPAGTFEESYAVPISIALEKGRQSGHAWFTSAVPIVYYAKYFDRSVSWIWGERTVLHELVDFGLEGAQSRFFEDKT